MRSFLCVSCVMVWGTGAIALSATPLSLAHEIDGPGVAITQVGVGLQGWGSDSRKLSLKIEGEVELALLYWAGRDFPCPVDPGTGVCSIPAEPYKDQVLRLDGTELVGTVVGTEFQPSTSKGPILNIGYGADVTEAVRAKGTGKISFDLSDGNTGSNLGELGGAGLIVVTSDPAKPPARALVFQGLDFSYGEDRTHGETEIAEAVTFNHGASHSPRKARVFVLVGDCDDVGRPDRIDISHNSSLLNQLDGSAGSKWDADAFAVDIPAGVLATTVQLFSEPWGKNPDSLLWVAAALSFPLPIPSGCPAPTWHADTGIWEETGVSPAQRVKHVFPAAVRYGQVGEATLRTALRFQEPAGLLGAAKSLVRQGAAALLNATHAKLEFGYTRTEVITKVGEALRTGNEAAIRALVAELRSANEGDCPLP